MVSFKNHFNKSTACFKREAKVNTQAEQETKAKSHSEAYGESVYKTNKTI